MASNKQGKREPRASRDDGAPSSNDGVDGLRFEVPAERGVFTSRTLNLRSIKAIGYDMDYTLVHYNIDEWERRAYRHLRRKLALSGWPVKHLEFDPSLAIRGIIIDRELGNLVKANRFGYVKQAAHGTRMMSFDEQKRTYARTVVDLADSRWVFLNALFSLSEAVMYGQLVDLLDEHDLPAVLGYPELYDRVRYTLDQAHMEGQLKSEITADPDRFVTRDAEVALTLQDQRAAGKKVMLITNSGWNYTNRIMSHAFDHQAPATGSWRELFDIVILSARKPDFFDGHTPIYQMVGDDGTLKPSPVGLTGDGAYVAGNAELVEDYLGLDGTEILFVGDHMYSDVHASKKVRRWRTALILRELEHEIAAHTAFRPTQRRLDELMGRKELLEAEYERMRLAQLRQRTSYGPQPQASATQIRDEITALRERLAALDDEIAPMARAATELHNSRWGMLMRAGKDKSHLAWQVEQHADIYTSRVSNLLYVTPYAYLRSPRGTLPHDPCPPDLGPEPPLP